MKFKILVIDDEPTLRESLQVALTAAGYEVMTSRTGEEGLEFFEKENPDLVLLDHWLPGINGDEVLRRIKDGNPETPVIIMTAQGSIELAVNLMKLGAFDFLVKPFDLVQIETLVEKGLERVRLQKEVEWLRAQYRERFRFGRVHRGQREDEGGTGPGREIGPEFRHDGSDRRRNRDGQGASGRVHPFFEPPLSFSLHPGQLRGHPQRPI